MAGSIRGDWLVHQPLSSRSGRHSSIDSWNSAQWSNLRKGQVRNSVRRRHRPDLWRVMRMRSWNTREDLQLLNRFAAAVQESKLLEPGGPLPGDPVDLQGLAFPTVKQCESFALPTVVVSRISGKRVFDDATLKRVDFSKALLDFSVWNNCHFHQVSFDRAKFRNVRFSAAFSTTAPFVQPTSATLPFLWDGTARNPGSSTPVLRRRISVGLLAIILS